MNMNRRTNIFGPFQLAAVEKAIRTTYHCVQLPLACGIPKSRGSSPLG